MPSLKENIRELDKKIKAFFSKIRNKIVPGDNSSLWSAVKAAKDQSSILIPKNLTRDNIAIDETYTANCFATFFDEKISTIKRSLSMSDSVHNGKNKLIVGNRFFMTLNDVRAGAG